MHVPTPDRTERFRPALWATLAAAVLVAVSARIFGPGYFFVTEREWQTAITAWWMQATGGGLLDAVTPLMGPPWKIPMELPLFQWLAAHATTPWLSLEDTGRGLSLAFFVIAVISLRRLALDLDLNRRVADAAAMLLATSPLYLTYAYSFTIENLAFLLALLYLLSFVRWLRRPSLLLLLLVIALGSAASLVKVTTWAVFAAAIAVTAAWSIASARRHGQSTTDRLIGAVLFLGIPTACAWWWVEYSDAIKLGAPLTVELTSRAMGWWNFGTIGQKLSAAGWGRYVFRSTLLVLGPLGFVAALPAIVGAVRNRGGGVPLPVTSASVVALISGPLVFTNLHFVHDYYALSGGVFAVILLAAYLFGGKARPRLLAALVITNLITTAGYLVAKQANYDDPLSEGLVAALAPLPADGSIVVFGSYLDARVPYQSHRKAMQTRRTRNDDPSLIAAVRAMKDENTVAVIARSAQYDTAAAKTASVLGLNRRVDLAPGVALWISSRAEAGLRTIDLVAERQRRLRGFSVDGPGRFGLILPSGPGAAPGIGLFRSGNYYLFDVERGLRVIHHRWAPEEKAGQSSSRWREE